MGGIPTIKNGWFMTLHQCQKKRQKRQTPALQHMEETLERKKVRSASERRMAYPFPTQRGSKQKTWPISCAQNIVKGKRHEKLQGMQKHVGIPAIRSERYTLNVLGWQVNTIWNIVEYRIPTALIYVKKSINDQV